jgi:hypothetical protein
MIGRRSARNVAISDRTACSATGEGA